MEGVLRPTSLTARYVLPLHESSQLRLAALLVAQKAVIRGIGTVSADWARVERVLFFTGSSLYEGGLSLPRLPTSSFIPVARHSLLADPVDRVRAWHLSSEIPLFRRETNEKCLSPTPGKPRVRHLPNPLAGAVTLHDRVSSVPFFSSRHPRSPLRTLVLMRDIIRSFFHLGLWGCWLVSPTVTLHPLNSTPGKIPPSYALVCTYWRGSAHGYLHGKLFYATYNIISRKNEEWERKLLRVTSTSKINKH